MEEQDGKLNDHEMRITILEKRRNEHGFKFFNGSYQPGNFGICLLVGYVIKTAIPAIKNRYIPLAALTMGTIIAILINMSSGINAEVIISGMTSGLASTGFYEMLRNLIEKDGKKKTEKDQKRASNRSLYERKSNMGVLIMGRASASVEQMQKYIKSKNPSVEQTVLDMIPLYLEEGESEGVKGDIAFAQSCLETGDFTFAGSAVSLKQNNFCGMGVTATGMKGNNFPSPRLGIRAQVQHLKAYACDQPLNRDV